MRCPGEIDTVALDNYITGHWGEDQFRGETEYDEFVDSVCSRCPDCISKYCPAMKGENVICLIIIDALDKADTEYRESNCPEVCMCCDEDWKTCTKDPNVCEDEQWEEYAQYQYEGVRES